MISKELLSEVFGIEVSRIIELIDNDYEVTFTNKKNGKWYNIINIYELAHKCKEWAYKNGYVFVVEQIFADYKTNILIQSKSCVKKLYFIDTEPEAIFKACEWIRTQNATSN